MNIYFQYCESTLEQILQEKRRTIWEQSLELGAEIKLNDYEQIDRLPYQERKVANIFYQEIEILRMIDHIVGALYFLDHLEHRN